MGKEPILVVFAGDFGSQFNGIKQVETIGDNQETMLDFSLFDAIEAGFRRILFVIRREDENLFHKKIGSKIEPFVEVEYAYQDMENIPKDFKVPQGRIKPWGTGHALLACKGLIDAPFAVIKPNVYYGKNAFEQMFDFLNNRVTKNVFSVVTYAIDDVLSDYGPVYRDLCSIHYGELVALAEKKKVTRNNNLVFYENNENRWNEISANHPVSMGFWGFSDEILSVFEAHFYYFLENNLTSNPYKCEFTIKNVIDAFLKNPYIRISVLYSQDPCYDIVYNNDVIQITNVIRRMKSQQLYPYQLWQEENKEIYFNM